MFRWVCGGNQGSKDVDRAVIVLVLDERRGTRGSSVPSFRLR